MIFIFIIFFHPLDSKKAKKKKKKDQKKKRSYFILYFVNSTCIANMKKGNTVISARLTNHVQLLLNFHFSFLIRSSVCVMYFESIFFTFPLFSATLLHTDVESLRTSCKEFTTTTKQNKKRERKNRIAFIAMKHIDVECK